jgi:hypothetical protein
MSDPEQLEVIDRPDLVRDTRSKAILSRDVQKLQDHRRKVALMRSLINNTNDINELKQEISEIKDLLRELIKEKNK